MSTITHSAQAKEKTGLAFLLLLLPAISCISCGGGSAPLTPDVPPSVSIQQSAIPGSTLTAMTDPAFRYSQANVEAGSTGTTWGLHEFYFSRGKTDNYDGHKAQFDVPLPLMVDFTITSSDFELYILGSPIPRPGDIPPPPPAGSYRLLIDGNKFTPHFQPGPPGDGGHYYLRLTFESKRTRNIQFESDRVPFGGVMIRSGDTVQRSPYALGRRAIFFGDEDVETVDGHLYTAGALLYWVTTPDTFAHTAGTLLGWETWSSGLFGTGYVYPVPSGGTNLNGRVQNDVCVNHPAVIVVSAGKWDLNFFPTASISAAAGQLFTTLRSCAPNATLIVMAPWYPGTPVPAEKLKLRDAVKARAAAAGAVFIDPLEEQWITGKVSDPTSGNAYLYVTSSGSLNQDGHDYFGAKLAEEIRHLAPQLADK